MKNKYDVSLLTQEDIIVLLNDKDVKIKIQEKEIYNLKQKIEKLMQKIEKLDNTIQEIHQKSDKNDKKFNNRN